jgi:valyl-tRNA synthetase
VIASWPKYPEEWRNAEIEQRMARMQELVRAVREVRNRYTIDAKKPLDVFVRGNKAIYKDFSELKPFIMMLAGVGRLESAETISKPAQAATYVHPEFEAYVSLQGLIDVEAEIKRLEKQLAEKQKHLQGIHAKLANDSFVNKAPADVVQQQREMMAELQNQIKAIDETLNELRQE